MLSALAELRVPYGYTVHDLNFACPTITFLDADGMYCGAQTDARRRAALPRRAAGVRRHRHRGVARAASRAAGARGVRHRAVALGRAHAAPLLSRRTAVERSIAHGSAATARPRDDAAHRAGGRCCPTTTCRRSRCWARSAPTRARGASSAWSSCARERGARVRFVLIGYLDRAARAVAERRRVFTRARPLRPARICPSCSRTIACARAVSVGGPGDVQLHAVRGVGRRTSGARAADRRAGGARCGDRRRLGADATTEWRDEARMLERIAALLDPSTRTHGPPPRRVRDGCRSPRSRRWPQRPRRSIARYADTSARAVRSIACHVFTLSRRARVHAVASAGADARSHLGCGRCGQGERGAGVRRAHCVLVPPHACRPGAASPCAKAAARRASAAPLNQLSAAAAQMRCIASSKSRA